jgi:hypothetical protein
MAKRILDITGVHDVEFQGKRVRGTELSLFLVYRNEFGVEVEIPFAVDEHLQLTINISGPVQNIKHSGGANTHITSQQSIDTVMSTSSIHTDATSITNLVAKNVVLGNTTHIGTCYAGCNGAHVNNKQNAISVGKSSRNPFLEEPLNLHDKSLQRTLPVYQTFKTKTETIVLPSDASSLAGST